MTRKLCITVITFGLLMYQACSGGGGQNTDVYDAVQTDSAVFDTVPGDQVEDVSGDDTQLTDISKDIQGEQGVDPNSWDWNLPDANTVYAKRDFPNPIKDEPYKMDHPMIYKIDGPNEARDVRCLSMVGQKLYAGTSDGVYYLDTDEHNFKPYLLGRGEQNSNIVTAITSNPFAGGLCVAFAKGSIICEKGHAVTLADDQAVLSMAATSNALYFVTKKGLYTWDGAQEPQVVEGLTGQPRAVAKVTDDVIAVATSKGLEVLNQDSWTVAAASDLPDEDCHAVAASGFDLAVGCSKGMAKGSLVIQKTGNEVQFDNWHVYKAALGGLAGANIHSISIHEDTVAMAYDFGGGAVTGDMAHQDYYVSLRWLPSDTVNAVLVDGDDNRWYATDKGISKIALKQETIAQKADFTHQDLDQHFWRMGFVSAEAKVDDQGNYHLWDSDNDGLWTQMMIGGFCYAYAVTGDKKYKQWAHKAIQTMFLQVDIPAVSFKAKGMKRGFVTRSLCREDEPCFADKKDRSNWHLVTYKGKKYYWKDDTSADEIDGHFFGYPLYYDLCAETKQEKEEVADHALAIANYIVDNGFRLIDLDGKETHWGHWQPDRLAIALDGLDKCMKNGYKLEYCISAAHGGGWLNSLEILGLLLSSYHMSGDPKFFNAFKDLVLKHRYWKLAMGNDDTWTVTKPPVENHSDHELAILAYHTLIRYDPDPKRRQWWLKSLAWFYEHEKPEHNPLWAGITAMFLPEVVDTANAVRSLREMPVHNRFEIRVDNTHRQDGKIRGIDRFKDKEFDRVFPLDEIRTMWWNGNPYVAIGGGNPTEMRGPMAFLLAYWSERFSGMLK